MFKPSDLFLRKINKFSLDVLSHLINYLSFMSTSTYYKCWKFPNTRDGSINISRKNNAQALSPAKLWLLGDEIAASRSIYNIYI